jgi:hypothetical protein
MPKAANGQLTFNWVLSDIFFAYSALCTVQDLGNVAAVHGPLGRLAVGQACKT